MNRPKAPKVGERGWELRQEAGRPGVLQLYIYGDVEGNWRDWWDGEEHESQTSADYFRQELNRYPDVAEIEIYINSYGGEVFEGTAIYNQLKRHPAKKTVFVDGFAASIASVGTATSTTLPTASMRARNTASRLSVFTRSPEGLSILLTAPTRHSTPAAESDLCRSKPVGPLS